MQRYVETLRKQPSEVKSHAAFVGAVAVTALVALVWLGTLPGRLAESDDVVVTAPEDAYLEEGFLTSVKNSVANVFATTAENDEPETTPVDTANELDLNAALQVGAAKNAHGVEVVTPNTILIETAPSDN